MTSVKCFPLLALSLGLALFAVGTFANNCTGPCPASPGRVCVLGNWNITWDVAYNTGSSASSPGPCTDCPEHLANCSYFNPNFPTKRCLPLNGVTRPIITTISLMPGPLVETCKGDRLIIPIQNLLDAGEAIGIHWHGQHMENQPYMDGVPMVTQCGILSNTNFSYDFYPTTVGTHFWHSHSQLQREDGLFGGFIVRENSDPLEEYYDVDNSSYTILVNDWYNETAPFRFIQDRPPASFLINGKGRVKDGLKMPRAVFNVESGQRYRFRLINTGFTCPFTFSIDNHPLLVIATDGNNVKPYATDQIGVFLAERFDFVVTANQTDIGVPATFNISVINDNTLCGANLRELAFLRYNTDPNEPPPEFDGEIADPPPGNTLNPINPSQANSDKIIALTSEVEQSFIDPPDLIYYLNIGFLANGPSINNVSFILPSSPLLTQHKEVSTLCLQTPEESKNDNSCGDVYCACTHYMKWPFKKSIELVMFSSASTHPMHMHGYYYSVIGQGSFDTTFNLTNYNVAQLDNGGVGLDRQKTTNPPNKDTIAVHSREYVIIRIYAKNPGWWFFHCHIDKHLQEGMALPIWTGEDSDLPPKPPNWPTCGTYNYTMEVESGFPATENDVNLKALLIAVIIGWLLVAILIITVIYLIWKIRAN